jgi:hypothetical protein
MSTVNENHASALTERFGPVHCLPIVPDAADGIKVKRFCYQTTQTQALPMMVFARLHEVICGL